MNIWVLAALWAFLSSYSIVLSKVTEDSCEVCVSVVKKLSARLSPEDASNEKKIESEFKRFCKTSKDREERFCYYVGGLETSATYIVQEMSKPMSWGMPAEKVCEKLKSKDSQICDLKYEKSIDLKTVDFKKLKVKDLKKILNDWGEDCNGCTEKSEFISLIKEKMPKYDPEAAKIHVDL